MGLNPEPGGKRRRGGLQGDRAAVTPVVGTVLILGITVVGIAGILFWGAPTIQRIQDRNAQLAVVGEFEDIQASALELSVPDHSRFPTVVVPAGALSLERGTRFLVTVDHDAANPDCDFRVTAWADESNPDNVTVDGGADCRVINDTNLEIYQVTGGNLARRAYDYDAGEVEVPGADFTIGDWLFRITQDNTLTNPEVHAEAWLISTDRMAWSLDSPGGERRVFYDGGALWSLVEGTYFLEREAGIKDSAFGSDYFGLWLRTLAASSFSEVTGAGSHQVYLSLISNQDRVHQTAATLVRIDVEGELSEPWCNALLSRNVSLTEAAYDVTTGADCAATSDPDDVRSLRFTQNDGSDFTVRLLHAQIYTSLIL